MNHVRVRTPRRITVHLGDLDALFQPVTTVHGKKQRLQALGHYYEAFTAATGNTVTEAYTNCLAYWQAKRVQALGHPLSTAQLEADLQAQLRLFVVDQGVLPARRGSVKVRFPGALTFNATADLGSAVGDGAGLPSVRFNDEGAMWAGNTALGRIPFTFKVEKQIRGAWVPAPNEWVHIQLIAPYYDDSVNELSFVNSLRATGARFALWGFAGGAAEPNGVRQFLINAMNNNFTASDPQRYNAHQNRGGKRGMALLPNVFDALPAAAFPGLHAPQASPGPRRHAVRVQTNATGDGGVLFLPSRMGGDCYRMRFFVDPNGGLPSDGTERGAAAFETGRFRVWKHVLWSNFLPKPPPNYPPLNSIRGVQARLITLGYDAGLIDGHDSSTLRHAVRAYQKNNPPLHKNGHWNDAPMQAALAATVTQYVSGGGPAYVNGFGPSVGPFQFATAVTQFRRMYCELAIEPAITAAAPAPQLTSVRHRDALHWAISQAQALQGSYGLWTRRNLSAMFSEEFETPFLFEIRHPKQYNRMRGHHVSAAVAGHNYRKYWQDAVSVVYAENGLHELFLRYLTGGASAASPPTPNINVHSTPGLTVVSAMAVTRMFWPPTELHQVPLPNVSPCRASGVATKERACSVFGGINYYAAWIYLGDGFTKNAMHEMGHTLYLRHQFTGNTVGGVPNWLHAGASYREDHDSLTTVANPLTLPAPVPYDRCLMGYLPCDGDFCGKCHLKLRGWDISTMPV